MVCSGMFHENCRDNDDLIGVIEDYVGGGISVNEKSYGDLAGDGYSIKFDRFVAREEIELGGEWSNTNPPKYHGLCFCYPIA